MTFFLDKATMRIGRTHTALDSERMEAMKLRDVIKTRYGYIAAMLTALLLALLEIPAISIVAIAVMVIASIVYLAIQFCCWRCPSCGEFLGRDVPRCCPNCGEKLDLTKRGGKS